MAATAMQITGMITRVDSRASVRGVSPGSRRNFTFRKQSIIPRLVKVSDPQRRREIRIFSATVPRFHGHDVLLPGSTSVPLNTATYRSAEGPSANAWWK